jgi:hypothetical protein
VRGSAMDLSDDKVDMWCTSGSVLKIKRNVSIWRIWTGEDGLHALGSCLYTFLSMWLLWWRWSCYLQTFGVNDRIRCFFGGTILTTITFFTIFVPFIYNFAIAPREYLWGLISSVSSVCSHHEVLHIFLF